MSEPTSTRARVGTPAPFRLVGSFLVASLVCWFLAAAALLEAGARRNRLEAMEGPIAHVLAGLLCLLEAALLAALLLNHIDNSGMLFAYGLLLLLGWAGGITLGHVGKLLSLSAWAWWPPGPRPKQAAFYPRGLWTSEAVAFVIGVQALAAAAPLTNPTLARAGGSFLIISALLALAGALRTIRTAQPAVRSRSSSATGAATK